MVPNDDAHEPLFRSLLEVDVAAASHPGKVRKNNEDHFLVGRLGRSLELLGTNLPEGDLPPRYEESGWFVVVADGMGGAEAGEVASRIAIEAGLFHHLARPAWFFDGDLGAAGRILDRMRELLDRIQDDVLRVANSDHSLAGMGTTLTVAYLTGGNLFLAHVGDSRAYLYRRGRLNQLTRDQTLVQQLVDQGSIEPEAATKHPLRHVLAHAIGAGEGGRWRPSCSTSPSATATACCCAATASPRRSTTPRWPRSWGGRPPPRRRATRCSPARSTTAVPTTRP